MSTSPAKPRDGESSDARTLTERVASGDHEALTALYDDWFDRMTGMAMQATGRDEAFGMDAAQDAFVKLIRNPIIANSDGELASYLRRLVVTSAYDRLRSDLRRAKRESSRPLVVGEASDANRGTLGEVESALALIEKEQGELILARYRFGWTLARIGDTLGLATGAVDGRIGRAVRKLRRTIDETHGERDNT